MKEKTKTILIIICMILAGIYMGFIGAMAGLQMK